MDQRHIPLLEPTGIPADRTHFRFHLPHIHLDSVFGNDWFALKAEAFARFFGTPVFLVAQSAIVLTWIGLSVAGITSFDAYPFILLNLAFSLQAAYAAPLILLAQTRQADRDKAHTDADARHREELASNNSLRQEQISEQSNLIIQLLRQNTDLTQLVKEQSVQIEQLTREVRDKIIAVG